MEERIGKVIHYYDKITVAVVRLEGVLRLGDTVHVKGKASDFEERVDSMQVNYKSVAEGKAGEEVAIKMNGKAKQGDQVYKKS